MTATHHPAPHGYARYRHYYLHLTSEAPNRLTISTFLGGLTFASFAALLTATALTFLTVGSLLAALIDIVLGTATFLFLLTTASTYTALQHLARLSPKAVAALSGPAPPAGAPDPVLDQRDVTRLTDAFQAYEEPRHFIPTGLALLFLSLVLIGFQIHWIVGLIVTLLLAGALVLTRTLVRLTFTAARETSAQWLRGRRKGHAPP